MPSNFDDKRTSSETEAWLRGPLADVGFLLTPAAHALLQASIDIERAAAPLSVKEVWSMPGGAPSVGFHLRHIAGSIDRLLTYARGEQLGAEQLRELSRESSNGEPAEEAFALVSTAAARIEDALQVLRTTPDELLADPREVGRAKLPSTVFGLLFHIAEHTQRHTGQIITAARIVRGLPSTDSDKARPEREASSD